MRVATAVFCLRMFIMILMIQMVDSSNTTPIGQDRETLTYKALLYLNVAVHAQACRHQLPVYLKYSVRLKLLAQLIHI